MFPFQAASIFMNNGILEVNFTSDPITNGFMAAFATKIQKYGYYAKNENQFGSMIDRAKAALVEEDPEGIFFRLDF